MTLRIPIYLLLFFLFSCSTGNQKQKIIPEQDYHVCDSISPYSFFGKDSVDFQKLLTRAAQNSLTPNETKYIQFASYINKNPFLKQDSLKIYYDNLEVSNHELAVNCILLFVDSTIGIDVKERHIGEIDHARLRGCFWSEAIMRYIGAMTFKSKNNIACYYDAINNNASDRLHILFLKMLIANYEKSNGDNNYSIKLRNELIEANFFKANNERIKKIKK